MRDGPLKSALKRTLARAHGADLRRQRRKRAPIWELAGTCGSCAHCCEAPQIAVGWLIFLPALRGAWLWWQRVVNGFVVTAADRKTRTYTFTCTHFDPATRRCDSYDSRPGICRDYPRMLLHQAAPEFFDRCGFRARAPNGQGLLEELQARGVQGEQLVQIRRRLRLD